MKKPELKIIKAALTKDRPYLLPNGDKITISLAGFYTVAKQGQSRMYSRLADAWRAL